MSYSRTRKFLTRTARVRVPQRHPTPWKQKARQGLPYIEKPLEHRTSFSMVKVGVCLLVASSGCVLSGLAGLCRSKKIMGCTQGAQCGRKSAQQGLLCCCWTVSEVSAAMTSLASSVMESSRTGLLLRSCMRVGHFNGAP